MEKLIATDHPIRAIKRMCDERALRRDLRVAQGALDSTRDAAQRESSPSLYTVRSDRQLCARLQADLLFRWFVDLPIDEAPLNASTYSKNQSRLLQHKVADVFFSRW